MKCPVCKGELYNSDGEEMKYIIKSLSPFLNPYKFFPALARRLAGVVRIIYFDFSSKYKTINKYLYCENCNNYFFICPHCNNINRYGVESPDYSFVVKETCKHCEKKYVYVIPHDSNSDGDGFDSRML